MRNDWNYTTAAAIFGVLAALTPTPTPDDAEEGSEEAAVAVKPPASWNEADSELKQDALNAVAFLARFTGTAKLESIDRDAAAMSLASVCKGTRLAALKPNYGIMVSVFISVRQAHGL